MLYMSNDRKHVFKTEQECCEYEQKAERDRVAKEKAEMERQDDLDRINRKYGELQDLISEYKRKHSARLGVHLTPFQELVNMLYR